MKSMGYRTLKNGLTFGLGSCIMLAYGKQTGADDERIRN